MEKENAEIKNAQKNQEPKQNPKQSNDESKNKEAAAFQPHKKMSQDFSDIDNLDRATESFMKAQHKALGATTAGIPLLQRINKRAVAIAAIGLVLISAIVGGIAVASGDDDQLRQPAAGTTVSTTTATKKEAENADAPAETPENAEPSETKPSETAAATSATSSTENTSDQTGDGTDKTTVSATSGTGSQTADTQPTAPEQPQQPEIEDPLPPPITTTAPTTISTTRTTTTTRMTTTTTRRTTTTTMRTTTTTKRTTTTTRRTTTTTTTTMTTTTTTLPLPNVRCQGAQIMGFAKEGDNFVYTIEISFYNSSPTASSSAFNFTLRCATDGKFQRVESKTSGCSLVSYSTPTAKFKYSNTVGGNSSAKATVVVKSSAVISQVSASCP